MNTLRLIVMVSVTIMICVNFAACSSNDDELSKDNLGIITKQKKLTELISFTNTGVKGYDITFSYDNNGRCLSIVSSGAIYNVTWGDNTVDVDKYEYSIVEGLLRESINRLGPSFAYNSLGQLIDFNQAWEAGSDITWKDGRIVKAEYGSNESTTFIYNATACQGYFPTLVLWIGIKSGRHLLMAHPELAGIRCNQLPTGMKYVNAKFEDGIDEKTSKFTYELDEDGYIERCTEECTEVKGNIYSPDRIINTYKTFYVFKWE